MNARTADQLAHILRTRGPTGGGELVRLLEISPATLSRRVRALGSRIVRIGRTRGVRYGLLDEIEGIGARWPVWQIDESGTPHEHGTLHWLHGPACYWETGPGQLFEGLPPFIADMAPQGFLGIRFPVHFSELELPRRVADWSEHHILRAVVMRGEDLVGDLIIGETSMDRWLKHEPQPSRAENYPEISRRLVVEGSGSSAGGEFPKFMAFDGQTHCMVKFTAGDGSNADRRWCDLLFCEHIAAEVLHEHGLNTARCQPVTVDSQLFLEIPRFDRVGERGRRATLTLGAIDDAWFGQRDNWPAAATRLLDLGWISPDDRHRILLLEAFGQMIFNNDRHFGNLSFYWNSRQETPQLALAPVYDMLPMALAPAANGMVSDRLPDTPNPTAALLPVWEEAGRLAAKFWTRVADDGQISAGFQRLTASLPHR